MNKTAIKNFAIWSRNKLIADVSYEAGLLGIDVNGIQQALPQSTADTEFYDIGLAEPHVISGNVVKQRKQLADLIRQKADQIDYQTAYDSVIEEVAYTWFNRLIAIRFMEVNDYLPSHVRVLSSDSTTKMEPDMVTNPFDTDFDFSSAETATIQDLKEENKLDDLFRMLFIKQCNILNKLLPKLFEKTTDYTELLLSLSVTDQDGVVYHLVHDIPEEDFNISTIGEDGKPTGQVEIIGWLYQYYISEPKDILINARNKYKESDIPFVTQLFTSDWIVHYMVENSLGRLWIEAHPNEQLKSEWEYYLDEAEQEPNIQAQLDKINSEHKNLKPEDIKVIDPCMGSGHILVYAFDMLMQIYESQGYMPRDAAKSILEHNLYGLDIDDRAFQLAYFSVMMKARQYNRRILNSDTPIHIYSIQESNTITIDQLEYFGVNMDDLNRHAAIEQMNRLLDVFYDAKIYGSILNIPHCDWNLLRQFINASDQLEQLTFDFVGIEELQKLLFQIVDVGEILSQQYHVVITNPPYMNSSYMPKKLKTYVNHNYADFKSDLFSVFISKNINLCIETGHIGMLTPYVWMFIASYEKTRKYLLDNANITSLVQLEYNAFEAACVPVASFTLCKTRCKCIGEYIKLSDFKGVENQAPKTLEAVHNKSCSYRYTSNQDNFSKIPGSPIAYWVSDKMIGNFKVQSLSEIAEPKQGLATADNNRFLRQWYECFYNRINFSCKNVKQASESNFKWFPYNKGGDFRKWYGNNDFVVNWEKDGLEIKNIKDQNGKLRSRPQNTTYYFKECISWSLISSSATAFRYKPYGFIFDVAGMSLFSSDNLFYIFGFCNSKIAYQYLKIIAPTINFQVGDIAKLPIILALNYIDIVNQLVRNNIEISRDDWDSFEISWDFDLHPLLKCRACYVDVEESKILSRKCEGLISSFETWKSICNNRFDNLKANEEELNRIFIDIYGLQDELTPDVTDKDVTVARIYDTNEDIPESIKENNYALTKQDVVKSLISYAVGCMFGRYSLDVTGLTFAGGDWDDSKYNTFIPDKDNVIPITDEDYFDDDIVGLFCAWLKKVYGSETLEENLTFVAQALGNKGNTSRDIIRNYFLKDFFKDHVKTYKKRPIYWLFDSGRQNGFKALIYMHRYNEDTIGNLRVDYLHRMERIYESEKDRMQDMAENSHNAREASVATKRKEKLQKQLKECQEYDEKISHLALARTTIDLDDGVKVNYEKVQTGKDGKKYEVLAKI